MIPSDKLINDWQQLMTGIKQIPERLPKLYKVSVDKDKKICINQFKVIGYFINNSYIEMKVIYKDEDILTVRHLNKFSDTVTTILEFIERNRDLKQQL